MEATQRRSQQERSGVRGVLLPLWPGLAGLLLFILVAGVECRGEVWTKLHRHLLPRRPTPPHTSSFTYAFYADDESMEGRKIYKNPRNAPSISCPRDEPAVKRSGRTCLRKCNGDRDCLSKRKVCLCDGICGLSCVNPDKECPDLDNPLFGFVEFNGRRVGAQARYKCQQGYHLIGDETRQCQGDGSWSSKPPECRENLYCTTPPVIAHARHDGMEARTRFEVNHTLKYQCYEGYTTTGFDVAKCFLYNNTMQWFGPEIECVPKECGDPGEILNGFKEGTCYSFSCRVAYHCRPGFRMEGRNNYYCQHDGSWNPRDLPTCKPIQCNIPENPENGKATFNSVFYNAVVSYDCNYGYMIVGPSTRRCGPNTRWSGKLPRCKEIDCGLPGELYNGWLEGSRSNFGAVIKFRCNDNMKYEGYHDHRTECQKNGTWSHPLPKCLAPCIVPTIDNGHLTNGTRAGSQVPHGSVIRVECKESYEPTFKKMPSTCYNGTWTHYPHCQPARCKKLPERPRNGMVIAPRTGHGMRARFRCKDGYRLMGSPTTKCHFGRWTGRTPWCRVVYCPFPGYLVDGRVLLVGNMGLYIYRPYVKKVRNDRRIRYECNRGYFLSEGPPGATCVAGRWSPSNMPKCSPELHPRVQWIKRSVNMSDYLEYLNATQEGQVPQLSGIVFGGGDAAGQRNFTESRGTRTRNLSSEVYHIEDPVFMDNNMNRSIAASLLPAQNTTMMESMFSSPKDSENSNTLETWAKFDQAGKEWVSENNLLGRGRVSGVHMDGSVLLARVLRNAKRETKGEDHKRRNKSKKKGKKAPHCEELGGEPYLRVDVLRAGRDTNYTYSAGARVRVTCLYGHGLNIGNKTAKCSRGRWKPMKPECISLPCSVPEAPNGQYMFNGAEVPERATIGHAEVVKFSCHTGYTVLGSDTLRCWYGEWTVTGTSPQCQPGQSHPFSPMPLAFPSPGDNASQVNPFFCHSTTDISLILGQCQPSNSSLPPSLPLFLAPPTYHGIASQMIFPLSFFFFTLLMAFCSHSGFVSC